MSFLKLTDVTKFYGGTCAVQAMNLSVQKGEFVSLLGPSGCGKTTTLRMVAGFEAVTCGRIELDGKDITHAKANTRVLGIVFRWDALAQTIVERTPLSEAEWRRSRVCTSPDGQPVVAMMPSACSAMISASIRDHLPS